MASPGRRQAHFLGRVGDADDEEDRALCTLNIPLDDKVALGRIEAKAQYYLAKGWDEVVVFVLDQWGSGEETLFFN